MNIELLFQTIKSETINHLKLVDVMGIDHPITQNHCEQIYGMQKAFAIVAGVSYTDYLLSKIS